jgi:hypothetical protein
VRQINPFLGLAIVGLLLYVGFNGAVALLPYAWTRDYDGLTTPGVWIGFAGAIVLTALALAGVERLYGANDEKNNGSP